MGTARILCIPSRHQRAQQLCRGLQEIYAAIPWQSFILMHTSSVHFDEFDRGGSPQYREPLDRTLEAPDPSEGVGRIPTQSVPQSQPMQPLPPLPTDAPVVPDTSASATPDLPPGASSGEGFVGVAMEPQTDQCSQPLAVKLPSFSRFIETAL